jgi:methionine synthase I (cobalamin-dependent)
VRLCYDAIVRTTLDLTDEAYQIAKTVARERNRSLGKVVSDFIIGQLGSQPPAPTPSEDEVFPTFRCIRRVTSEDVKALLDEE